MTPAPATPTRQRRATLRQPAPPAAASRAARLAMASLAVLAGCALQPVVPPLAADVAQAAWRNAAPRPATAANAAPLPSAWWQLAADPVLDPVLDAWVRAALAGATDVRAARARLDAARAQVGVAGAAGQPALGLAAGTSRRAGGGTAAVGSGSLSLEASWEPDFFGAAQRQRQAAAADADVAADEAAATRLAVSAEVVRLWAGRRVLQQRIALAERNAAGQRETAQLETWRREAGLVSALEVDQARSAVAQTEAGIAALALALEQDTQALALLTTLAAERVAQDAGGEGAPDAALVERLAAATDAGLPAELLRRRPDVRASEAGVRAASARVGVAQAARLPSLSLSGSLGVQAASLAALGGPALATLAANAAAPLFDAGRLRAQLEAAGAAQDAALVAWEAGLRGAQRDVENALAALRENRRRAEALRLAAASARSAAELARLRRQAGTVDFAVVLEAERTQRVQDDALAAADGDAFAAWVLLVRALGGPPPEPLAVPADAGPPARAADGRGDPSTNPLPR